MPIAYPGGSIAEHRLVRSSCGLFDVSHMGRLRVTGPGSLAWLERLVTADLASVGPGGSTYALLCREDGGVLDDLFIYRLDEYWLVVMNAANRAKDLAWFTRHLPADGSVTLHDASEESAMIAFQGPQAVRVMDHLTAGAAGRIPRFGAAALAVDGVDAGAGIIVGRTGYTGEDGVELFPPADVALQLWERLLAAASQLGVDAGPIGLAARDSLRFEPGFALYGHELTEQITPVEARLTWACNLEKEFIGRDAIAARREAGPRVKLATVRLTGRGVPREGYRVLAGGEPVGTVATGMYAPTVDAYCANVFVASALAKTGADVDIEIRGQAKPAVVVKRPLYTPAYR